MSSTKGYLNFVLEQLSGLDDIQYRAMMGEFVIYYRQKIIGGIYDDRFLIKPVKSAISMVLNPIYESPYEGGKAMLLVEEVDDKVFLTQLITKMYEELPEPKKKKIKNKSVV
ncbi:TfoX/Sxy family protein [Pasteurella oralis]|uniref:TfoX/Sxy family protein n=1 Tax=Pasteurella oralis TaxID=1071947 RepID=UPI000C7B8985|nr:transcriptional regulator [Pasteurella oralis]